MLLELVVENYAVVERLRIHFHAGLNLLTGETGSGKSIVVDALGLLLGGRASADMVRTGESRARVAGIFDVRDHAAIRRLLEPAGLEIEDGELLIEREILAGGKSRAFVGSRPVAVSLLKDLAPHLADIHGQHDQQLLFSADAQRDMLDAFAGHRDLLERAAGSLPRSGARAGGGAGRTGALRAGETAAARPVVVPAQGDRKRRAGARRGRRARERAPRAAERAAPAGGRRHRLRRRLRQPRIRPLAHARAAAKRVDELCRIDSSLEPLREHLKAADLSLQEASYALRDYLSRLEANPARLEEIETRLAAIDRLKRKYGQSDRRNPGVSWKKCGARSPPWSTPASAWKSCAASRSAWPPSSKSWPPI